MARAMRKRIFLPLFTILIFFPLLIFALSYTRFFNDEVRSILTSIVDEQINAQLYMGKIHGSILGSFRIDGAALMYDGKPIALVDTIEVSHLPLSIIAKTVEVLQCRLVNPRFYLIRYRDGTLNVDHIGKGPSKPGGKSDWFIILKNLKIHGGEFSLCDSTDASSFASFDSLRRFNSSDFRLKDIDLSASGNISEDNLSSSIKNISLTVDPIGVKVNSLKFDFFTSKVGAEVSGLDLVSELGKLKGDLTLTGQNLLDPIELTTFRKKQITASLDVKDADIYQVKKFLNLPIDTGSRIGLNCFASGNLDTLYVKQLSVKTDSSFVHLSATLFDLTGSEMAMKAETHGSIIDPFELSAMLNKAGVPNLSQFKPFILNAVVDGTPSNLNVNVGLKSGGTEVNSVMSSHRGSFAGRLNFRNLHLEEILNSKNLTSTLTGEADFTLKNSTASLPEGTISLQMDSSTFQQASVRSGRINISSSSDSINFDLRFLTSKGNISGSAMLDASSQIYSSDLSFSEFDLSSFVSDSSLSGISTGKISLSGKGLNVDSLDGKFLVLLDHSTLGGVPVNNSAFNLVANTRSADKTIRLSSPIVDASIEGNYVADKLPSQLSELFSAIADSFSNKITGRHNQRQGHSLDMTGLNASLSAKVKDGRFIGKILGLSQLKGNPEAHLDVLSDGKGISLDGSVDADTIGYSEDSLQVSGSQITVHFNLSADNDLSLWDHGKWSMDANFHGLDINKTHLSSKILRVGYSRGSNSQDDSLSITALCQVDSLAEFYIDASGEVKQDSFALTANTLVGKFYGVSLASSEVVHIGYKPETFTFMPIVFSAGFDGDATKTNSKVLVKGQYSLEKGPNLQFEFSNVELASLQRIGRLDTVSLRVDGKINGEASLTDAPKGVDVSIDFSGKDINYNGAKSKLVTGTVKIHDDYLELSSQLSKQTDSSQYALRIDGTVPLSDSSSRAMQLRINADSLNISFLTPFLPGVGELEGTASGDMNVSGRYSLPEFNGELRVSDGRIVNLAANGITYPFTGTIIGEGDKLILDPVSIVNNVGQTNTTMMAHGSLEIRNNSIASFDIDLDGTLLVLNSPSRKNQQDVYGVAIVGSGLQGLKLKGSLSRPLLEGSGVIQSTNLTLLPLQTQQTTRVEDVMYRFPTDMSSLEYVSKAPQKAEEAEKEMTFRKFC